MREWSERERGREGGRETESGRRAFLVFSGGSRSYQSVGAVTALKAGPRHRRPVVPVNAASGRFAFLSVASCQPEERAAAHTASNSLFEQSRRLTQRRRERETLCLERLGETEFGIIGV